MPKSKALPRPVVTPEKVLRAFLSGKDTADIAAEFQIREPDAYKLLTLSRNTVRLFDAEDRDTLPAEREPPMESF
jgi:hypothetical protein